VQRLAQAHDVDLSRVTGTGVGGRVTRKDVQKHIDTSTTRRSDAPPSSREKLARDKLAGVDVERMPLTPIRRMIAENMVKSATQIPQAWSIVEVDVTSLVERRSSARDDFQRTEGINLTYLPFVVKAVAESLRRNPMLNSSWDGDAILIKKRVNIGVAVATGEGLVVPVIHDADSLSIAGLAKSIDGLTDRARRGKLDLADVQGGTFTVNNTGALGSVVSQPLVNYPQAAIITTEAIVKRPVVVGDAIAIRSMMNLCLTFDHRILDGAEAGAFINEVKRLLECVGPDTAIY
jgi:2-oxoisovalerate dehydrogenase E2 component (dihydrolipoyl transacylase)